MFPAEKRWLIAPRIDREAAGELADYHPILAQVLFNRGYKTKSAAQKYLAAEPPFDAASVRLLGIERAVERISQAIHEGQPIAVYGDYDADGVTATALLTHALRRLGGDVQGYIPNRFDEGYGLNKEAILSLQQRGIRLVITVDCGIRSPDEAALAAELGLDMIITDHHQPGLELPKAVAIINPRQPDDPYPDKDLAGVGLAYKLAEHALRQAGLYADEYLDLVALGTVADMAPLTGENRGLVRNGLAQLRQPSRQGVMSLIGVTRVSSEQLSAGDIGYILGPRLNAAGRLDTALSALELLLTDDPARAGLLAQQLEIQNRERQEITQAVQEMAEAQATAEDPEGLLLMAVSPEYNRGVVGLAASRLTEKYYRPSIVAQQMDEFTRGSCRSIPEFHITQALDQVADLLDHHGGHAAAAGFTIRNERLPEFTQKMRAIARQELGSLDLRPTLKADAELHLADLRPEIIRYLGWLQPTGIGNPQANFVTRDLRIRSRRAVGRDYSHLKLVVTDGSLVFDAIAFRQGYWIDQLPDRIDILYTYEVNEFNGRTSLQLNVKDIKPSF